MYSFGVSVSSRASISFICCPISSKVLEMTNRKLKLLAYEKKTNCLCIWEVFNILPHTTSYCFINCFWWHRVFVYGELLYVLKYPLSKRKMDLWELHPRKPLQLQYLGIFESYGLIFSLVDKFSLWKYVLNLFLDKGPEIRDQK